MSSAAAAAAAGSSMARAAAPAIVAVYTGARAPFNVTVSPDKSLLLQRAWEMLSSNEDMFRALIQQKQMRKDGKPQYVLGDWNFTTLHVLIELERGIDKRGLTVLLLSVCALQTAALQINRSSAAPMASFHTPSISAVMIGEKKSRLRLVFCSSWEQMAAAAASLHVRLLYIAGIDTMLGSVAPAAQLRSTVLPCMLEALGGAQLFPPESFERLFEHKNRTYAHFGEQFMLPAKWEALSPAAEDNQRAAQAMLQWAHSRENGGDGEYMLKGSWSWGAITAERITVADGECPELADLLQSLHTEKHQSFAGIQPYDAGLRGFELRVFVVQDSERPCGWRQAVCVQTGFVGEATKDFTAAAVSAQLQQPTHGKSLEIARFVDRLMDAHQPLFLRAAQLGVPVVRIDCGIREGRAYVNELGCIDQVCFTGVHYQDLAHVHAAAYAKLMIAMLQQ